MEPIHFFYMFNVTIPTLDQLKVMIAVVDSGSFSAAAKRLHRSQPVISYSISNLEEQLGVALFERNGRRPELTEIGKAVLAYARRISLVTDELRASVAGLIQGVEGEVAIAIDALYPTETLARALKAFSVRFPTVGVKLHIESLGSIIQLVTDGDCQLGVSCLVMDWPDQIESRDFGVLSMLPVSAPGHPLASYPGPIPVSMLREHLQLTIIDRTRLSEHRDLAISGIRTWRVGSLGAMLSLLEAGVGWGHMPVHMVRRQLESGRLVRLPLTARKGGTQPFTMIHRVNNPPGPAGQWLAETLVEMS
ncbi:LysR family transcriptional regulator [Massilia niastensis]|uniref:LysR family transcriptional regulator n=1 Tax=Massilia niastensis TaxID=544911 RepID=UPI000399AFD1|nr:LysR family transcriptional regulator [Massilia niastensis]